MNAVQSIADLEHLSRLIAAADSVIDSENFQSKVRDTQKAHDRSMGIWMWLPSPTYKRRQHEIICELRDDVYRALPDSLSITPAVAWYLAVDAQAFSAALSGVERELLWGLGRNAVGMVGDLAKSATNPAKIGSFAFKALKNLGLVLRHAAASDDAEATRNPLVRTILSAYRLCESPSGSYGLKRGKWGLDAWSSTYGTLYRVVMTEHEVEPGFDFNKLSKLIENRDGG